jgi:hemerythrin
MEIWASSRGGSGRGSSSGGHNDDDVQYLCVCVESLHVARQFQVMFHFTHVVNAYIPSRQYMPRGYGQLGCSGFIVVDARGHFISRQTKSYLQYGNDAFYHVEQLLDEQRRKVAAAAATSSSSAAAAAAAPEQRLRMVGRNDEIAAATAAAAAAATSAKGATCPMSAAATESKNDNDNNTTDYYYAPPPSVGVDSMDDEHQACAAALKELHRRRTRNALELVIQTLEQHFSHEETLMAQNGFGGDGSSSSSFSALHSHIQDHQRILQMGRDELQRIMQAQQQQQQQSSSSSSSSCNSTTKAA